jgi:hypothetical protein
MRLAGPDAGEEEEEEREVGWGGFEAVWPSSSTNTEEFL